MSRVRVYIAQSIDGFIAAEDDDLSWLPAPTDTGEDFGFSAYLAEIGCLLMGRRTYDVVEGFGVDEWAYGDTPVHVWTRRPLSSPHASVHAVSAPIEDAIASAKETAAHLDVYLDGGETIRAALDAGLVDEVTVTTIPVVLGAGRPLFAGVARPCKFDFVRSEVIGPGLVKTTYRVNR